MLLPLNATRFRQQLAFHPASLVTFAERETLSLSPSLCLPLRGSLGVALLGSRAHPAPITLSMAKGFLTGQPGSHAHSRGMGEGP